jgi:hypothetical protein
MGHSSAAKHKSGSSGTQPQDLSEKGNDQPTTILTLLARIAVGIENLNVTLTAHSTTKNNQSTSSGPVDGLPSCLAAIARDLGRIADKQDPPPPNVIDSPTLAAKLGCTTTWIAQMAREGSIPQGCIVEGTGRGKPWKFYRRQIESWLADRSRSPA